MKDEFYLDNAATTPVHPEVIKTIMDVMTNVYGNPSSLHNVGMVAKNIVNTVRKNIAQYINCRPQDIIFTSGACEANSLAIAGWKKIHGSGYGITSTIEHKSVMKAFGSEFYKTERCILPVDGNGSIKLDLLESVCRDFSKDNFGGFLVSIQAANNEIGTIQRIKEIAKIVHKYNGVYHCDATQLFADRKIDVEELDVDMLSMSGQKINAPKGIGFLYVRNPLELSPIIYGSQENGLRGGTESVSYIAGLGKAIELLNERLKDSNAALSIINKSEYLASEMIKNIPHCILNGVKNFRIDRRLNNNINISFKDIEAEILLLLLNQKNIYVSSGSACNSGDATPSYVLRAIDVPDDYIRGTIRITISDEITLDEIDYIVEQIKDCVEKLREINGVN